MQENLIISIKKEKQSIYIFCKANMTLDCQMIINTKFDNIKESKGYDINLKDLYSYEIYVFLNSTQLLGGIESPNPLFQFFFGESDSNSNSKLKESKPIYHFSPNENHIGTLEIYLDSFNLTLLNYSILDSSLNIKLQLTNTESKAIFKAIKENLQKKTKQDKNKILNNAYLCPVLQDNQIKCPHNGIVKLESNLGRNFKSDNIPMILESDLLYSPIINCTNYNSGPCTKVSLILPNARGLKKYNDDYPIMQDLVNNNIFSDKGFPLTCTLKKNHFKINSPNPSNNSNINKESLENQIDSTPPILHIITHFRDLKEYYLTPTIYENRDVENQSGLYTPNKILEITLKPIDLESIPKDLFTQYNTKNFSYRILTLRIAYCIYEYILIIPKIIPSFVYKILKNQRNKDELRFGYGRFINLQKDYIRNIDNISIQGQILLCPSGMDRVRVKVE